MKAPRHRSRLFATIVVAIVLGMASPALGADVRWTQGTAWTLDDGKYEKTLLGPFRFGLTPNLELGTHAILNFRIPNLRVKYVLFEQDELAVSTEHTIAYPTPLLRTVSRRGSGGVLPATTDVPPILTSDNRLLASRPIGADGSVTFRMGLSISPRLQKGTLPTIDFPFVYPRTASYHTLATGRSAVQLQTPTLHEFRLRTVGRLFVMPGVGSGSTAAEQSSRLVWSPSRHLALEAGYIVAWGRYPSGRDTTWLPLIDVSAAWP